MTYPVGTHDNRDDYLTDQLYRGPFVLQKSGNRDSWLQHLDYVNETLVQSFKLPAGHWVVFAKLNIINPALAVAGSPTLNRVSVTCELHVGKQVDYYEMLEIPPVSMRLASLVVGANLTSETEGKLVYKRNQTGVQPDKIGIVNVTIAATPVAELRLLKT